MPTIISTGLICMCRASPRGRNAQRHGVCYACWRDSSRWIRTSVRPLLVSILDLFMSQIRPVILKSFVCLLFSPFSTEFLMYGCWLTVDCSIIYSGRLAPARPMGWSLSDGPATFRMSNFGDPIQGKNIVTVPGETASLPSITAHEFRPRPVSCLPPLQTTTTSRGGGSWNWKRGRNPL